METGILVPDTKDVDGKAISCLDKAKAMVVKTIEDLKVADAFCVGLKDLEKVIIGTFKDPKEKAWATHKSLVAAESSHLVPVVEARKIAKAKMSKFQDEQEAIRQAEERRLQEIERKKAEDAAIAQASEAEAAGDKAGADAIIQAPVEVMPVVVAKSVPKAATVIKKVWTYRVDKEPGQLSNSELLEARAYLIWDTSRLTSQARSTHDAVKVPGVTFFNRHC